MFCKRMFRLFIGNSVSCLLYKGSIENYRTSCHFMNFYQQRVRGSSYWKTVKKILPYDAFRSKTNCRLFLRNQFSTGRNGLSLLVFSGLLGFFQGKEEEKEPELILTIKRAILSIQREEFKVAEQILHVALKLAQEQQNENAITYIYDLLANVSFEIGEWDKAEKLFLNVMQRELAKGTPKDDMKIIHMSLKLAKIYESLNDDKKADQGFHFCMDNLQTRLKSNLENEDVIVLWAMTLDWYARFLQQKQRFTEAIVYYKRAYEMCVQINGEIHEQNVILLNDIGTVTYLSGDQEGALEFMNKAIEIGKHLPNMEDFSSVYVNLGNIYLQKGLYREAKKSCTEGFQNATRHNNVEGLKEASTCLDEIKKLFKN